MKSGVATEEELAMWKIGDPYWEFQASVNPCVASLIRYQKGEERDSEENVAATSKGCGR